MKYLAPTSLSAGLIALTCVGQVLAQSPESTSTATVDAMLACRAVIDEAERLACLDEQLSLFASGIESGRLVIVERATIRAVERDGFGIQLPSMAGLGSLFSRSAGGLDHADMPVEERTEILEDGSAVVYASGGGIEQISDLPVRSVTTNRTGNLVVALENGQVWVQSGNERVRAPRRNEMEGLTATIEDGAMTSFFMELSHTSRRFRVRRSQ